MRAKEFIQEYVNKKMLDPSWHAEKTVNTKIGQIDMDAVYHGAVTDQIIITARQNRKYLGQVRFVVSTVDRDEPVLVAGNLSVDPDYRRKGVATAMYQWAKELGNSIEPSHTQTDAGRAFWQGKKNNESVTEQQLDEGIGNVVNGVLDKIFGPAGEPMQPGEFERRIGKIPVSPTTQELKAQIAKYLEQAEIERAAEELAWKNTTTVEKIKHYLMIIAAVVLSRVNPKALGRALGDLIYIIIKAIIKALLKRD